MGIGLLFEDATKVAVKKAVADVEKATSAELVVAVAPTSGFYRHADYVGGMVLAALMLGVFLYWPEPFDWTYLPIELGVTFALGAVLVGNVDAARRFLTGRRQLDVNVRRAARERFVDLGVSKTQARTGILVFVSAFERRVEIVTDTGIDAAALGSAWSDAVKKLDRSLRLDADPARFVEALRALGPPLGAVLPRAAGDVNELDDAVDDASDDEENAS
jgi:putative membrane protein